MKRCEHCQIELSGNEYVVSLAYVFEGPLTRGLLTDYYVHLGCFTAFAAAHGPSVPEEVDA